MASGSFTAITGPSGSGKSTLLHLLGGLDKPTKGTVYYRENDLYKYNDNQLSVLRRRRFGFVFQSYNLVKELTGYENILLPVMLDSRQPNEAYLNRIVDLLGIRDRMNHLPSAMSGGQQQRFCIARALANKPAILFADEPTGNLDGKAGREVLTLLRTVSHELGITLVLVTHDLHVAEQADREKAAMTVVNDWAFAGQELPIVQLYTDDPQAGTTEDGKSLYESCTRRDALVTIGGVLDSRQDFLGGMWGAVLTTEEGLRNMGLFSNGWDTITVYLDGIVDEDTEGSLTQSVTAIARRAEGSRVYNHMESAREDARTQLQLMLLMGAITIVFFAVAAGMIVSTITRQLQSDGKRIGMLRAVGAEEKTILRCYSGQVFISLALGMVLSVLFMAVLFSSPVMNVPARYYPSGIATILVFCLFCLGLCFLLLRRRVRQVTRVSIIDNIREL